LKINGQNISAAFVLLLPVVLALIFRACGLPGAIRFTNHSQWLPFPLIQQIILHKNLALFRPKVYI